MNISANNYEDLMNEFSSETSYEKSDKKTASAGPKSRAGFGRRRGKAPQQFNGIHRRRRKQIRW